jgi:6-phosphofructokinase 1
VEWDVPTIGVPATIDNDIPGTDFSIGFATALEIATEAVDKIRDTATSHGRIFVIEMMGRTCGMLAMAASICCGAEEFLIPERPTDLDEMCQRIQSGYDRGKQHAIIVVAEGAAKAAEIAEKVERRLARDVRIAVLGHIQRGGNPTAFDRILASRLGVAAVERLLSGERNIMVGLQGSQIETSPLVKEESGVRPLLDEYVRIQEILR